MPRSALLFRGPPLSVQLDGHGLASRVQPHDDQVETAEIERYDRHDVCGHLQPFEEQTIDGRIRTKGAHVLQPSKWRMVNNMLFDRLQVRQRVADAIGRVVDPFVERRPSVEPCDLNQDFGVLRTVITATTDHQININRTNKMIISVSPQPAEPGMLNCRGAYGAVHGNMMRQLWQPRAHAAM